MDVEFELRGVRLRWDAEKGRQNLATHGVTFEQAAQVFLDPFVRYVDVSREGEAREGAIGADFEYRVLFVVHLIVEEDHIRLISAWRATRDERRFYEAGYD
ncbi:MAG: hypothetical protein A2W68_02470 [Betaproteobacteria bacterium RIFCSPLOWO2_02_64_14]|nr:MAG: hypothetical protein A2W68_02470 [Betaproteobacteria bacterium RIFCSPLOWO2_02_64_14]